jgi:hypothetical protein
MCVLIGRVHICGRARWEPTTKRLLPDPVLDAATYMLIVIPYILLKSLLMGCRADSVPWVLYIGPSTLEGGRMVYDPDFFCVTVNPNRSSSLNALVIAFDWCCRGIWTYSFVGLLRRWGQYSIRRWLAPTVRRIYLRVLLMTTRLLLFLIMNAEVAFALLSLGPPRSAGPPQTTIGIFI